MCRLSTRATQTTGSGTVEPTELAERPPLSRASRRTTVTVTVYGNLTLDNHHKFTHCVASRKTA